jgi:hypothetical protein
VQRPSIWSDATSSVDRGTHILRSGETNNLRWRVSRSNTFTSRVPSRAGRVNYVFAEMPGHQGPPPRLRRPAEARRSLPRAKRKPDTKQGFRRTATGRHDGDAFRSGLEPDTTYILRQSTCGRAGSSLRATTGGEPRYNWAGIDRSVVVVDRRRPATHADTFFFETERSDSPTRVRSARSVKLESALAVYAAPAGDRISNYSRRNHQSTNEAGAQAGACALHQRSPAVTPARRSFSSSR